LESQPWRDKISNTIQLGGIETSILDNGSGRGARIAWVNTGTGLRYKLVIDRAMDIAEAFFNQHSLAWISHRGVASPEPFSDRGAGWLRTFGGGLLTTCGLSHFGPPESDAHGERGADGLISNQRAELESIVQPDIAKGNLDMSIRAKIRETQIFGPSFELTRTISGTLGEATIRIHDEVVNAGNTPTPHMLLYHCNFGWPLVDEGTDLLWKGTWQSPNEGGAGNIFREGNNFRTCPAPLEKHHGTGEAVAFIDPVYDDSGQCSCGLYNEKLQLAVELRFDKKQLPWLTNWQHWGKGEYVTGLEPGTNPPTGQAKARQQNQLIELGPGECRMYDLELEVLDNEMTIRELLKKYKL
jgi:hypothetical protein